MSEKIIVYGHTKGIGKFSNPNEVINYLSISLYAEEGGRYRYSQQKNADIIIISWEGCAYGHLIVKDIVNPTEADIDAFSETKKVYIIKSSAVYENPVKIGDYGIENIQFGKKISEDQFELIKENAGDIRYFP
jgi:hypothetical protein